MSTPRLPTSMEVMEMLVEEDGSGELLRFLVPRDSGPYLASALPPGLGFTGALGLDGATPGAETEILRARAILPSSRLELAGQVMARITWGISSPADAGTTARVVISAEITPANGGDPVEIVPPRGGGHFAVDAAEQLTNWITAPVLSPEALGYRFEAGDLLEFIVTMRTVDAGGGTYNLEFLHDPTTDPDRMLVEWMTGVDT